MTNIYTEVSPRNGVDFSRIRKHASGGGILKFQNSGKISGIGYNEGTSWRTHMFDQFRSDLEAILSGTDEEKRAAVSGINETQLLYEKIRRAHPELTPAQVDELVRAYLKRINQNYRFVNDKGVAYGEGVGKRYNYYGKNRYTGDNSSTGWKEDGVYSGETQDRTVLGYYGDWDEKSDEFQDWQSWLKNKGLYTRVNGKDGAYILGFLGDENDPNKVNPDNITKTNPDGTPISPDGIPKLNPDGTPVGPGQLPVNHRDYTADLYTAPFLYKPTPFTSPITNGAILGLNLAANKYLYNNEMQKKVPLVEAPRLDFTMTNDKATTDTYNNSASRLQSQYNNIASQSSNLELNQTIQMEGADKATELYNQGQIAKTQGYNRDRLTAVNTANQNNNYSVLTANQNRQNLAADWDQKLDSRSKYLDKRNTMISDNIIKNRTDYGQWKQGEEEEMWYRNNLYNKYLSDLDKQKYNNEYINSLKDENSKAYNRLVQSGDARLQYLIGIDPQEGNDKAEYDFLAGIYGSEVPLTDEEKREKLIAGISANPNYGYAKTYTKARDTEKENAITAYNTLMQGINTRLGQTYFNTPTLFSTLGLPNFRIPWQARYQQVFKEGGILKMKDGDLFVKYLEHHRKKEESKRKAERDIIESNRKAQSDGQKIAMLNAKQLQDSIKRELDSLDRETLMLLRSVFK